MMDFVSRKKYVLFGILGFFAFFGGVTIGYAQTTPQIIPYHAETNKQNYAPDYCELDGLGKHAIFTCLMTEKLKMQARLPRSHLSISFLEPGKRPWILNHDALIKQNLQKILAVSSNGLILVVGGQTQNRLVALDPVTQKIMWQSDEFQHAFKAASAADGDFILLELRHGQNWNADSFAVHKLDKSGKKTWFYLDHQITGFSNAVKAKQSVAGMQINKNLMVRPDGQIVVLGQAWQPKKGSSQGSFGVFALCLDTKGQKQGQIFLENRDWQQPVMNNQGQVVLVDQTIMYDTDWLRLTTLDAKCRVIAEKTYAGWQPGNPSVGDAPLVAHLPILVPSKRNDGFWAIYPAWEQADTPKKNTAQGAIFHGQIMSAFLNNSGKVDKVISLTNQKPLMVCDYQNTDDWSALKPILRESLVLSATRTDKNYVISVFAADSGICKMLLFPTLKYHVTNPAYLIFWQ